MSPARMTSYSLRRRLQAWLVLCIAGVWIGVASVTYLDAGRELNGLLDAHLAQAAQLLIALSGHELHEVDTPDLTEVFPYGQKVTFQVWAQDGSLMLRSSDAPTVRLSSIETGFADSDTSGRHWRVYGGWSSDRTVLIQVAEDRSTRERLAARIALNAILPLLIGLPLLAALISWIVTQAVRPLVRLSHEVGARRASTLLPIEVAGIPQEAAPLVERLNDLFERARRLIESERRFTANAAHELRNPLAALRAQAEIAAASSDSDASRAALKHVMAVCDHMARTVQQLLLLARVEEQTFLSGSCRLDQVAKAVLSEMAPEALAKGTELVLEAPRPVSILGHTELLQILIRNLIDNAIRHGGSGIEVVTTVRPSGEVAELTVADGGVGVDAETRANLGQRFFRPVQTLGIGSGLGLSLVQRIAEIHRGHVVYGEPDSDRGLQVRVMFPLAESGVSLSDS